MVVAHARGPRPDHSRRTWENARLPSTPATLVRGWGAAVIPVRTGWSPPALSRKGASFSQESSASRIRTSGSPPALRFRSRAGSQAAYRTIDFFARNSRTGRRMDQETCAPEWGYRHRRSCSAMPCRCSRGSACSALPSSQVARSPADFHSLAFMSGWECNSHAGTPIAQSAGGLEVNRCGRRFWWSMWRDSWSRR